MRAERDSPMFRLIGLDHLVLRIVDRQRRLPFYVQALGCSVEPVLPAFDLEQLWRAWLDLRSFFIALAR